MVSCETALCNSKSCTEFPVGDKLRVKLLISRGWLWHENVLIGEFGALSEDFRVAKRRIFCDFRVSDVTMPAASGSMVKTGTAGGFQAASGVTRLRILSGLFFSRQPKAIASITAMLLKSAREAWGRKSAKTGKTGVSSSKNTDSWGTKDFKQSNSRVKSTTWKLRN